MCFAIWVPKYNGPLKRSLYKCVGHWIMAPSPDPKGSEEGRSWQGGSVVLLGKSGQGGLGRLGKEHAARDWGLWESGALKQFGPTPRKGKWAGQAGSSNRTVVWERWGARAEAANYPGTISWPLGASSLFSHHTLKFSSVWIQEFCVRICGGLCIRP